MALITDVTAARGIYRRAAELNLSLTAFCAENVQTIEAVLVAASRFAAEHRLKTLPVIIAFTAHYAPRRQLSLYTASGDIAEGFLAIRNDILRLTRRDGPYGHLNVMVHLDHAHPDADRRIMEAGIGFFASVMFDGSHLPLAENIKRTAAFVREFSDRLVVEGAVDEIPESSASSAGDVLTGVDDAERYVRETGVDLIVCNLGTEHRATLADRKYHGQRAREISARVGKILVLHGTSSLSDGELGSLAADGVVKVNVWTRLEEVGGQAIVRDVQAHAPQLLAGRPPLNLLTETHRRFEVWMPAVTGAIGNYFKICGCEKWP